MGETPPAGEDAWARHRSLLFTIAYEILGSAADAEDVVQDTWLRWHEVDQTRVTDPRGYLVRVVTRQALNRLRTVRRRREDYVGPWLPEPLRTTGDIADDVALADSVSTAMLLVLETLAPVERAVFVLREVFDVPYAEIAESIEKTPEATRQIASRARKHVAARQPRRQVAEDERREVLARFTAASQTGDLQSLVELLAPDVVLVTDGGGAKKAALRPIHGTEKVLRFLHGVTDPATTEYQPATVNGDPGLVVRVDGHFDAVVSFEVADGLISHLYVVRNPAKLTRFGEEVQLDR